MAQASRLSDLLLQSGMISPQELSNALQQSQQERRRLLHVLTDPGHINEQKLIAFLSRQYGIAAVSLRGVSIPSDLLQKVARSFCERHCVLPLAREGQKVLVAISDPTDMAAIDDIRFLFGTEVQVVLSAPSEIKSAIAEAYKNSSTEWSKMIHPMQQDSSLGTLEVQNLDAPQDIETDDHDEKPVIRLINKLILEGIQRRASDIHVEPFEGFSRVRFRIDGSLHEVMRLPTHVRQSVPSRIKIMAQMDISEKRLPQDGRIQVKTAQTKMDIRVSSLPTLFGEKMVLRLLDQSQKTPDLEDLGFEQDQLKIFEKGVKQPYGMVLVTGPTGSGKSTTLYAALSKSNGLDTNISTVEDPVEYNMTGINQVQMRESIGLSFATVLRAFLRQDPDVIMVGEVRDQETAEIAVKAALTGHLVYSTLHTNDAASSITRLLHLKVEPFLITAAVVLIQAQRLVRVVCSHCKQADARITVQQLREAEVPEDWLRQVTPVRGKGCEQCQNTGYFGRQGIFEIMPMTESLRALILQNANHSAIKKQAMQEGMRTLRQSALHKFAQGLTTLDEVLNNSKPDNKRGPW